MTPLEPPPSAAPRDGRDEKVVRTVHAITANRLDDGRVVYLRADRAWVSALDDAELVDEPARRDELVAWAAREQSLIVTGCYALDVGVTASGAKVLSTRERIRAAGEESVRRRLGVAGT